MFTLIILNSHLRVLFSCLGFVGGGATAFLQAVQNSRVLRNLMLQAEGLWASSQGSPWRGWKRAWGTEKQAELKKVSGDVFKLSIEHGLDERPQFLQLLHPGTLYLRGSDELLLPRLQVLLRWLLKISALEWAPYANHTAAGHLIHWSQCMGLPRRACRSSSFHQEQEVKEVLLHSNHAFFFFFKFYFIFKFYITVLVLPIMPF